MRILVVPSVLDPVFGAVAATLQARFPEITLSAITFSASGRDVLVRSGARWKRVETISTSLRQHRGRPAAPEALRALESAYGMPNLYLMAAADPFVWTYPRTAIDPAISGSFELAEEMLAQVDVVLAEGVDSLPAYAVFAVARARRVPFVVLTATRIPGRVTYFRDTRFDEPYGLAGRYDAYRATGTPAGSLDATRRFIEDLRATHRRPEYVERVRPPRVALGDLGTVVRLARARAADPDDYIAISPGRAVANRIRRILRAQLARRVLASGVPTVPFAFFPLHLQPEITTLVYAPFHTDQLAVVEQVAKSLPAGWWLVVKEHPAALGRRPLGFYRRLAAIPGVLLLAPSVDSHVLVLAARAVVTITSTVGWEALLYRRPVITLGDVFFNRYEGVRHVANVRDLPDALAAIAADPTVPEEERLTVFVAAVMDSTFPGLLDHPDANPAVLAQPNIERLTSVTAMALGLS